MKNKTLILMFLALITSVSALAQDSTGTGSVGSSANKPTFGISEGEISVATPPPQSPTKRPVLLLISGDAAKVLFQSLYGKKVRETSSTSEDQVTKVTRVGKAIECTNYKSTQLNSYGCSMEMNQNNGSLKPGPF